MPQKFAIHRTWRPFSVRFNSDSDSKNTKHCVSPLCRSARYELNPSGKVSAVKNISGKFLWSFFSDLFNFSMEFFSFVLPMMTISKQQTRSKQCRKNQITTFLIHWQRNFFVDDWYDLFFFCARVLFGNFTNCFCVCFGNSFTHAFDLNVWACSLMHKNVQTLSVANCVHVFVCVVYLTDVKRSIVSEIQFCQKKL